MPQDNSIGAFRFLQIEGAPEFPAAELEIVARPGVDGEALWLTGVRGKPFSCRTLVDAVDLDAAVDLYNSYLGLVGASPVQMTYRGVSLSGLSVLFAVLEVKPVELRAVAIFMGGLNDESAAICRCEWTLLAIDVESE